MLTDDKMYNIEELFSWFIISINEILNDIKFHDLYKYNVYKESEKVSTISKGKCNRYFVTIKENIINCEISILKGGFLTELVIWDITIMKDYRSKGLFTKIITELENIFYYIKVKDIVNERLNKFLKRRNYILTDDNTVNLHKSFSLMRNVILGIWRKVLNYSQPIKTL